MVAENEIDPNTPGWPSLLMLEDRFLESKNPVYAIEMIMLCHEAGLYPPLSIMDWLADSLKRWHDQNGHADLESVMGLRKSGQTGNAFREAIKKQLEENLMTEFCRLRYMFSITNSETAQMIATRLEDTEWNYSGYSITPYSESTLQDKYERKWAKLFKNSDTFIKKLKNSDDQEKKKTLSRYPHHAYRHIKKLLKYV